MSSRPVPVERQSRIRGLVGPCLPHPPVVRVVADPPGPLLARPGHHVEVVHVVRRGGDRRPVPAVRDQHGVAVGHLFQQLDRARLGAVDPLVANGSGAARGGMVSRGGRGEPVVVDLLELGLAALCLVVLVRRVGRPVRRRSEHLRRQQLDTFHPAAHAEVVDLPGTRAAAAQRDVHAGRRLVAERHTRAGPRTGQRDGGAVGTEQPHMGFDRQIGGIRHGGENAVPAGQLVGRGTDRDVHPAGQREHDHLVRTGGELECVANGEFHDAQTGVPPAGRFGGDDQREPVRGGGSRGHEQR